MLPVSPLSENPLGATRVARVAAEPAAICLTCSHDESNRSGICSERLSGNRTYVLFLRNNSSFNQHVWAY